MLEIRNLLLTQGNDRVKLLRIKAADLFTVFIAGV